MSADTSAAPPSATVVIAQKVRPGREKDYLCWQAEMNELCRTFPGYEAAEVVPPVEGVQSDYVVVFRFDTFLHLEGWLKSDAHRTLLARGQEFFVGDARQHVVAAPHAAAAGAGMVVSTRVKPGREAEYRAWQTTIDQEAARFPGFSRQRGVPGGAGLQEEWVVVVRFDSAKHLQNWLESEPRRRLNQQAARLWDEASVESFGGGFPGWFTAGQGRVEQGRAPAELEASDDRGPGPVSDRVPAVSLPVAVAHRAALRGVVVSQQRGERVDPHLAADARRGPRLRLLAEPAAVATSAVRESRDCWRCSRATRSP
jgi:antibiotic biosynthesis monooxygenase (ABM) superfamily enzyme